MIIKLVYSALFSGTAIYHAASALFLAQSRNFDLGIGKIVGISLTATLTSIGTPGIPQGAVITFVIVLRSIGLPVEDVSLVLMVDWFFDRFGTLMNILGKNCSLFVFYLST